MSHEEYFQIVNKEIAFKKAFPVYFQPMCDLIITTYVLFVPEGRPKRKKQKEEKSSFFNEWKQTSLFIYFAMYVCMYEQSNNDIFEVQSIITNHN